MCWYYKCNLSDVEFHKLEPRLIEKILADRLLNDFLNSIDYIPIAIKLSSCNVKYSRGCFFFLKASCREFKDLHAK